MWATRLHGAGVVLTVALTLAAPAFAGGEVRTTGLFAPADLVGTAPPALTRYADVDVLQVPNKTEQHPTPPSTGFRAFVRTTGSDFAAFPRRTSTWVILGVGAASALLVHPVDDNVNAHIVGSDAVGRFRAGQVDRFCVGPGGCVDWTVCRRAVPRPAG